MNGSILTAMSFGDRLAYAGRMTLIGMVTIFVALSILWLALVLFRRAIEYKTAPKESKPVAPAAPTSPVAAPASTNDGEIVAAITAAISLMLADDNGGKVPNFRVVSFRRTRGNNK